MEQHATPLRCAGYILAGPFPRHTSPVSFPVALSESASLSCATSSPERPRRVNRAGRPSGSFSKAATSGCATHDTEDTADSGSSQDQHQSLGDLKLQHRLRASREEEAAPHRQQLPKPVSAGSHEGSNALGARPWHNKSPGKPGVSLQEPSQRPRREMRAVAQSRSPEEPSSLDMQNIAAQSATPRAEDSEVMALDARQEACGGGDETVAPQQQVPALQKLKLRVRSRHRTSSQGCDLPAALQALELTEGQLPLAAEAAPDMAPASAQLPAVKKGMVCSMQDRGRTAAGQAAAARTGTGTVPAEEQQVFRAVRTLPRSPMKAKHQPPPLAAFAQPSSTPAEADAARSPTRPHSFENSPVKHAQPQCMSGTSARSHDIRLGEAQADLSPVHLSSTNTPDLAPQPQQQPGSPPGSGVLAVNSMMFPAVSNKAQRSPATDESAVFTPSHKLARSPPRQPKALITHEDSGSQRSPCSFPQALVAEELPDTPRMRAIAQSPVEKHAGTCAGSCEAESPAHGSHHW